ncbi:MAG: tol-pal system YbgF family protein [Balneolaceae bacterium]
MSRRLSKEEMEQDLLIEYSSRFMHFYQNNKAAIIGGGIGLVVVVGLIIGYFIYSSQQEQEAQVLMGIAERYYSEGELNRALYGDDDQFTLGFIQIADNYSGTDAGNLANYYAAVVEFELQNYESALEYIKRFSPSRDILGVAPIAFHAVILMELEQYEAAAKKFEEAARWDINDITTPENYYYAAQAYIEAGMNKKADELLERILDDYPGSQQAAEAQRLRGFLAIYN